MKSELYELLQKSSVGLKVIEIFKNLAELVLRGKSDFIVDLVDSIYQSTTDALKLSPNYSSDQKKIHLSKQQYVAVVGVNQLGVEETISIGVTNGFHKGNIKVCNDVGGFKNGKYAQLLNSANCIAIIFGPIPHSHSDNLEKNYQGIKIYARPNSGEHSKLKITKHSLSASFQELGSKLQSYDT